MAAETSRNHKKNDSVVKPEHQMPAGEQEYIGNVLFSMVEERIKLKKPRHEDPKPPEEDDGGILLFSTSKVILKSDGLPVETVQPRPSNLAPIFDPDRRLAILEEKLGGYAKDSEKEKIQQSAVDPSWVLEKKGFYGYGIKKPGEVIEGERVKKNKEKSKTSKPTVKPEQKQNDVQTVKKKNKRTRERKRKKNENEDVS